MTQEHTSIGFGQPADGSEPTADITVALATPVRPDEQPITPRHRGRVLLVAVLVTAALLVGGGVWQFQRSLPGPTLSTSIPAELRIPGPAVSLPWPAQGSAELLVDGVGRLGGRSAGKAAAIGSVAKVMTAYLVLQDHPLADGETGPLIPVTPADVADFQARIKTQQSQVELRVGEKLTERDALAALLLPSANDVAHLLAQWVAGSQQAFLARMNSTAATLGMSSSRYTDPSGFLPSTVSTAADQVLLGRAALKIPAFAELVALRSTTIPVAGEIKNTNNLLGVEGIFGIKTGSTDQAGGNLLFAAKLNVDGQQLTVIGAVFNQPGAHTPEQLARVNQVVRGLLAAVRNTVKSYTLMPAGPVGVLRTAWQTTTPVQLSEPLRVIGWPGLPIAIKVSLVTPSGNVTAGQVLGSLTAATVRVELHANSASTGPSLWWRLTRHP